jgi:diadenosine tetraphosphatase ApaH/serine/threonine PP2A family protein phosphatase
MRYALLSDIHANLTAFKAVLEDIERQGGVDEVWCLGDIVGYGPEPGRCIELLKSTKHTCVAGNHDLGAIGRLEMGNFNPDAATAIRWTVGQLTDADVDFLAALPTVTEREGITLVHGSPREPVWEYLVSISAASENFAYFKTRFCMVGHSHMPLVFKEEQGGASSFITFAENVGLVLGKGRLIINPGSVGQPRDGDPRASYAIYDGDAGMVRLHRVSYDINEVQLKIMKNNLPVRLSVRLGQGV